MCVFFFLDYSLDDYKTCVQVGLRVGANIKGVYVTGGLEGGGCDGLLNEMGGKEICTSVWSESSINPPDSLFRGHS